MQPRDAPDTEIMASMLIYRCPVLKMALEKFNPFSPHQTALRNYAVTPSSSLSIMRRLVALNCLNSLSRNQHISG
eukprot:2010951-Rhodomonas_salina.2